MVMVMDAFTSKFLSPFTISTTKSRPWPTVNENPPTIYTSKTRSRLQMEDQSNRKNGTTTLLAGKILNAFRDIINKFIDPPIRRPWVNPHIILVDNFVPVDELPPTECEVIYGYLPECLNNGTYIRNGPNPQFIPRGPYHHFDGDGMLHVIRISSGRVTLCSRYVRTYKFSVEREIGGPVVPNFFSDFNGLVGSVARVTLAVGRILAGQFNPVNGIGVANTNLALICGRLYATCESDLPYAVTLSPDGDIVTVGRHDFDGKLLLNMTAHPKTDPETQEAFAFRYSIFRPVLTYFRFDREGNKQPDVPIFSVTSPSLFHDFAITKKYAVFVDIQIGFTPFELIFGSGSPIGADLRKVSRVGIIPRYATNEDSMRWFEVPGLNSMHVVNAWEEEDGESVVLVVPNVMSVEYMPERMDLTYIRMEKVTVHMRTGLFCMQPLAARNLELAVVNPNYITKKTRYVYASIGDPLPKISGLVKLDISLLETDSRDCIVATRMFGPGCYGGEPFFVAKELDNPTADEDDGYLVTYMHNENTGESRFLVMDAQSPSLDIVAAVRLPHRVPYGFHGLFLSENHIKNL